MRVQRVLMPDSAVESWALLGDDLVPVEPVERFLAYDADKLTEWLTVNVCEAERRPELVRDELLVRCRAERIEPPAAGGIDRIVRSALHQAEQRLTARIVARLPVDVTGRLRALVAVDVPDDDTGEDSV